MSIIEAVTMKQVFGKNNPPPLMDPRFRSETRRAFTRKVMVLNPPTVHSKDKLKPFTIDVQSNAGAVNLKPFQINDDSVPKLKQEYVVGGVVIEIAGKDRLIYVSSEYPIDMKMVTHQYLLKADAKDNQILVIPQLEGHKGRPYIMRNSYRGRKGLLLLEKGISITDNQGQILVKRT